MPQYKLTYFNVRGYAEVTRQLFHLADVEFEDVRFNHGDGTWEKLKPETPFGQVPVLNVDGLDIPQSTAIARYVARKFGFAGKTAEDEAWVDALVDQWKDFVAQMRPLVMAIFQKGSEDEVEKIRKEVANPARDAFFAILNKRLAASSSGFLVGDSVTWADLLIVDHLTTLEKNGVFDESTEPKIAQLRSKVNNLPKLKEWLASRPDTQF